MAIPWDNLLARWCPTLDTSGRSTSTLNQVNASGAVASPNNAATLTDMVPASDWVNDTGSFWSIDFKADNDRAIVTGYGDAWGTADRSYSFWLRVDNDTLNEDWISNRVLGVAGTQTGFAFGKAGSLSMYTRPLVLVIDASGGHYKSCIYTSFYEVATWVHVVVAWTNSTGSVSVFRDGIAVAPSVDLSEGVVAGKTIGTTGDLTFSGRPSVVSGRSLDGALDDICEWSIALSSTQASEIYAASRGSVLVSGSDRRRRRQSVSGGVL